MKSMCAGAKLERYLGGVGEGSEYSYIRVLPDEFLLKSVVFNFISK